MSALKSLGLNVVKANVFLDSSGKHNKFFITKVDTGRKVKDPELLEAIRLTIINNLIQYHPVCFAKYPPFSLEGDLFICQQAILTSLLISIFKMVVQESSSQLAMGAAFGLLPPKEQHRDAFLICTVFMTAVVGAMVLHLLLRAAGFFPGNVDAIPGILLLFFIAMLICPLDIFYRPTRFCFIRVIRNIICSPFYKVLLVDFFMADQLTSQDDSDVAHLANMGKYISAMVAAGARVTYGRQDNNIMFFIVIITSVTATMYQLYWDFVKD
ncbi:hypothetical protein RYX36_017413 [Vicia faba]